MGVYLDGQQILSMADQQANNVNITGGTISVNNTIKTTGAMNSAILMVSPLGINGNITLSMANSGQVLTVNTSNLSTITVPQGLLSGFRCTVLQLGTGNTVISAQNVTFAGFFANTTVQGQYASISMYAYQQDAYTLMGGTTATVAPPPPPVIPFTNWFQYPGMDGMYWKLPLQTTAKWITVGSLITSLRQGTPNIRMPPNFCVPWVVAANTDPDCTITDGTKTVTVKIPVGTKSENLDSGDNSLGGTDRTRPYIGWTCNDARIDGSAGNATHAGSAITCVGGMQIYDCTGPVMEDVFTGMTFTGASDNAIGNLPEFELQAALANNAYVPPHTVACSLDFTQMAVNTAAWPIAGTDTGGTGQIPEGVTIGIPYNTPKPTGKTRGYNLVWDILQQFGVVAYNVNGSGAISIETFPASSATIALVNDMNASFPAVMANTCILAFDGTTGSQIGPTTAKGMVGGLRADAFPAPALLDLSYTGGVHVLPSTFNAWYATQLGQFYNAPGDYPSAPPQAAAVGFKTLAFADDFTNTKTIATTKFASSGSNWYWGVTNPNGTFQTVHPSQTAASTSNGNTGGGSAASPAGGILTLTGPGSPNDALLSIPGWALNNGSAILPTIGCWQHGYFEAYIQSNQSNISGAQAQGWPAFWAWSAEGLFSYGMGSSSLNAGATEIDIEEQFGTIFGGASGSDGATVLNPGGQTAVYANSGSTDNNWHTYGVLWEPGFVTFFKDNVARGARHSTAGWSLESTHLFLILGCGLQVGGNMNVDYVRVWQ